MRVAIVTGAASGIGRATAERLASQGWGVVAMDRAADNLGWVDTFSVDGGGRVVALAGDVTDEGANEFAVDTAISEFGRLDAAALNAGLSMSGGLTDLSMADFDRAIDVNVRGVVLGMRAVTPIMRERGDGRIVVTASTSGIGGDPNLWAYNTAKGAAINLVRSAAVELGPAGITVNAVCPGPTETGMTERLQQLPAMYEDLRRTIPLQRWGKPVEVAAMIAFLASADASFVNGAVIPVDGGVTANTGQFRPGGS